MKIVTGVGENAHVTPEEFRMIFEGTFGNNAYILDTGERMAPELVSNNLLKIKSGLMCDDEGNISSVDVYDEVELKNGTQGMKRIDLIVNRYTKNDETKIEKNEWICITGTPAASNPVVPAHITGSLRAGDLVKDIPFIKVHFDGLNITQIETLVSVTKNIKDLTSENEDRKNEIAQLNGNNLISPDYMNERVLSVEGGYVVRGNTVIVNLKLTSNHTSYDSPSMLRYLPIPKVDTALQCIDITSGIGVTITEGIPCGISTTGIIFIKSVSANKIYAISGTYVI